MTDPSEVLFHFHDATLARYGGDVVFRGLSWTVRHGETWAIVGPIGAGKTSLVEAILGRFRLDAGSAQWPLLDRLRRAGRPLFTPSEVIVRVAFKEESRLFSYQRHYYQQRYNFIEPEDDLTLADFLRSEPSATEQAIAQIAERLHLQALLPLSLIHLSNGQMRRARIAKALLAQPELLVLDDPMLGLDASMRQELTHILGQLVASGRRLLLITRPDTLPDWITHTLELDAMQVRYQGVRRHHVMAQSLERLASFASMEPTQSVAEPIIELEKVNVTHGGRPILRDVSWTVRQGERWALLGPNGAGKTTLLSLICGDHPQAYCNVVRLFGRQRGSGESIWDVKRQIGFVSPELHMYFTEPLTVMQTIATGFFDGLIYRPIRGDQEARIRHLADQFGLGDRLDRPFRRLSTGEQRLTLLLRAVVKSPPLLILDEPFQGLDSSAIRQARSWLDTHLRPEQTLLFVTHHTEEIPASVTRCLRLANGRVVEPTELAQAKAPEHSRA